MGSDESSKTITIRVRIEPCQKAFLDGLLREYRKKNPNITLSDVVRNVITGFESLMTIPLYMQLKKMPQETVVDKYREGVEGFLGEPVSEDVVKRYKKGVKEGGK